MCWKNSYLVLGVLLLALRPVAAAESPPPASEEFSLENDPCLTDVLCRSRFNYARKLSKEDNYEEALGAYESAYQRRPVPWLLINVGRTLQKLGRLKDAIARYEQYLTEEPAGPAERKQRAEQFLREAREEQAAEAARKPKVTPPTLTVPESVPEQEPAPPEPIKAPTTPPPTAPVVVPTAPAQNSHAAKVPAWFIGGVVSGAALFVVGAGVGGAALGAADTARGALYVGQPSQDALDAQQKAHVMSVTADVLLAVGLGAVAAVTTAYLVRRFRARGKEGAVAPAVVATKTAAAVGISGHF